MSETDSVHPAIRTFMARHAISADALRQDGRLMLTIDGAYRVQVRRAADGGLALQAKVMTLPGNENSREAGQALERLLNLGAGMLREHSSTLCFETHGQSLQLQQALPADTNGEQLDNGLAEFTNALQFWVRTGKTLR